jgi:hypothetical protein
MRRFVQALKNHEQFGSGTRTTPEFDSFYRKTVNDFKKHFSDVADNIQLSKGHFYFSGFLTRKRDGQVIYFSISDVRYFPGDAMLIRTAKSYQDYTGGRNHRVTIDQDFEQNFKKAIDSLQEASFQVI